MTFNRSDVQSLLRTILLLLRTFMFAPRLGALKRECRTEVVIGLLQLFCIRGLTESNIDASVPVRAGCQVWLP